MHHAEEIKKGGRPLRFLDDAELRRGPASTWRHIPPPPSRTAGRGEKGMPLKALRVHRRQEPLRQDRRHATPVSKSKDCPTNAAASRAKRNLCARIQDAPRPQIIDRSDELSLLSSPVVVERSGQCSYGPLTDQRILLMGRTETFVSVRQKHFATKAYLFPKTVQWTPKMQAYSSEHACHHCAGCSPQELCSSL